MRNEAIKDSGSMRQFATGAHRDNAQGKGRCDLLPLRQVAKVMADKDGNEEPVISCVASFMETLDTKYLYEAIRLGCNTLDDYSSIPDMMLEVSKLYEAGAIKYGENNWKNGMPVKCYLDSGLRHYLKTLRGDNDEPHYRGFVWNLLCALWTIENTEGALDDLIVIEK